MLTTDYLATLDESPADSPADDSLSARIAAARRLKAEAHGRGILAHLGGPEPPRKPAPGPRPDSTAPPPHSRGHDGRVWSRSLLTAAVLDALARLGPCRASRLAREIDRDAMAVRKILCWLRRRGRVVAMWETDERERWSPKVWKAVRTHANPNRKGRVA